jgi:hypothetical protein
MGTFDGLMDAGPSDPVVGMDEFGRPVRRSVLGHWYSNPPAIMTPKPQRRPAILDGVPMAPALQRGGGMPPQPPRATFGDNVRHAGGALKGLLQAALGGMSAPGRAAKGEPVTLGDVWGTALSAGGAGGIAPKPAGAFGAMSWRDAMLAADDAWRNKTILRNQAEDYAAHLVQGLPWSPASREPVVSFPRTPAPKPKRPPVTIYESPTGNAPDVDWFGRDFWNDGTPASAMKNYGRGKGTVTRGYIDADRVTPKLAGGASGYDWSGLERGLERGRGAPPPATVRLNKNGSVTLMDGNHRVHFWKDRGFDQIPAFIIDER